MNGGGAGGGAEPPSLLFCKSVYKVEKSSLMLIALFWPEIGRCRGRNLLDGNQA